MWGSSSTATYGPDYFMERNVVLVTFNYRVGAFGTYRCMNIIYQILYIAIKAGKHYPSHWGVKFCVCMLSYVKNNIKISFRQPI